MGAGLKSRAMVTLPSRLGRARGGAPGVAEEQGTPARWRKKFKSAHSRILGGSG